MKKTVLSATIIGLFSSMAFAVDSEIMNGQPTTVLKNDGTQVSVWSAEQILQLENDILKGGEIYETGIQDNKVNVDSLAGQVMSITKGYAQVDASIAENTKNIEEAQKARAVQGQVFQNAIDSLANGKVKQNTDAIAKNEKGIQDSMNLIGGNRAVITRNRQNIEIASQDRNAIALSLKKNIDSLANGVVQDNANSISQNNAAITQNGNAIGKNSAAIGQNKAAIGQNKADILDLRQDFEALSKDYYSFKSQTNGAIAGVAAMGQLAQPYGIGNFNLGAAVGYYESEEAIALGVGYRASNNVTLRAAVSANSGNDMNPIVAASVNYEW